MIVSYDYWDNATHAHWRLSPKRGVSDRIEAYQGQSSGFDWFGQQRYLIESDYVFDQVEPSRLFETKTIRIAEPQQELVINTLKISNTVLYYWEQGEIENASKLVDKVIYEKFDYLSTLMLMEESLIKFRAKSSSKILIKLLKNLDTDVGSRVDVRDRAAEILGELRDVSAITPLVELLEEAASSRADYIMENRAEKILGKLGDCTAVAPLIELLKDSNKDVRISAVWNLSRLGDHTAIVPLIELFKDSDSDVRSSAAWVLGELEDRIAVAPLTELLKDSNSDVRSSAAVALVKLGDRTAVAPLIELLKDSGQGVRSSAAVALGQLEDRTAVAPLIELLKDSNSDVRRNATEALSQLGDGTAVAPLIELLKDSNSNVRMSATEALSQLGDRTAVAPLIELLKDSEAHDSAARALGQLGDWAAVAPLIEYLKNPGSVVGKSAAETLSQFRDQVAIFPIISLFNDSDSDVRKRVTKILIQLGDRTAISSVADLLENSTESLKPEEIEKYQQSLNGSHFGKKKDAITALGQAKVAEALPHIRPLLTNPQENLSLRLATLDALGNNATVGMAEEFIQVIQEAPQHFAIKGYHALGNTGSPVAAEFLQQQLKTYDTCKANWRACRDQDQLSDFDTLSEQLPKTCENFIESDQVVLKTYLESPLAFAIAKLNTEAGIQLLSHNIANVRKGAALGLGMMGSVELLQQLYQQHQRITSTKITQVFKRQAFYRAIDNVLIKLELRGTEQEWQQLKAFHQYAGITHPGIKERVEWTIDQLDFNLHRRIKNIKKDK